MVKDNFPQEFKDFGRCGEKYVYETLKDAGYFMVATSLIDRGGAPMLEGHIHSYVLPDMLAFDSKTREQFWVDAKSKARCTFSKIRKRMETGFELRHWDAYLAAQQHTGIKGAVAFVHASDRRLYLGELDVIGKTKFIWTWSQAWAESHPGHAFKESMVFFDVDCFDWYDLGTGQLAHEFVGKSVPSKTVRPWEKKQIRNHRQRDLFADYRNEE